MAAVVNYSPPWWVNLLHRLPHFNLQFETVSSDFRPEDSEYQKSVLLLGGIALVCLALDLLFLLFYSFWLCCRRRKTHDDTRSHSHTHQPPNPDCCCTAWCVIIATLVCSAGIAVGFYGNGESCDGANRLAYSLRHANRTVAGVDKLVTDSALSLNQTVEGVGDGHPSEQTDYVSIIQKLQGQLDELVRLMVDIPFWSNSEISLEDNLAFKTEAFDWYRWLVYLTLLLFDVLICLLVLFGLIRNSKGTLIGVCLLGVLTLVISWGLWDWSCDFCVSPDTYITRVTKENAVINQDILQYYLRCSSGQSNPFQHDYVQALTGWCYIVFQDYVQALTGWCYIVFQDYVQALTGWCYIVFQDYVQALTGWCYIVFQDYVQALTGLCYDGVEGLIYLVLFSFVTALMFSSIVCSVPHTWQSKRMEKTSLLPKAIGAGPHDNLYRVHMPSLYSCGSSYGSEASIPATAHTVSNAPEVTSVTSPLCENTPLIGRESPPPSYTSSMRAKYLATSGPDQNRRSVPNDQLDPASRPHPLARPQSSVH
uniref:Protein tweety homolog n=1 Tax=Oncorhynchus tshawytscha TaxID=74940 RepID=A0AAZ3S168_ONCTS